VKDEKVSKIHLEIGIDRVEELALGIRKGAKGRISFFFWGAGRSL